MQVTSCANETKWRELKKCMQNDWQRAPYWRVKYLPALIPGTWELRPDAIEIPPAAWFGAIEWDRDWYYHFRSDNIYRDMEFIDMRPHPKAGSMTKAELVEICRSIGLEFEVGEEFIRVYGYRRSE